MLLDLRKQFEKIKTLNPGLESRASYYVNLIDKIIQNLQK